MRIIYKQTDDHGGLGSFGVKDCCFKRLSLEHDKKRITKKTHHHTSFEMHFVTEGFQEYEVCGEKYRLESGSFLLIYPSVPHTVISCKPDTQKYSITFNKPIESTSSCLFGKCNGRVSDSLRFISEEALRKKEISSTLIENCILEILVWAFRISGLKEDETEQKQDENLVLSMAKQYIEDNVELNPSVSDVAEYCHLSAKQLTRIFNGFEGISPGEYIIRARVSRIEALLSDRSLSLRQIGEIMSFNNEYYFNAFFKKYSGMPPGGYRKMTGQ